MGRGAHAEKVSARRVRGETVSGRNDRGETVSGRNDRGEMMIVPVVQEALMIARRDRGEKVSGRNDRGETVSGREDRGEMMIARVVQEALMIDPYVHKTPHNVEQMKFVSEPVGESTSAERCRTSVLPKNSGSTKAQFVSRSRVASVTMLREVQRAAQASRPSSRVRLVH